MKCAAIRWETSVGGIRYKLYTESGDFVCETDDESKVMQISAALNATQEPPAAEGPELLVPTQITTATEGGRNPHPQWTGG